MFRGALVGHSGMQQLLKARPKQLPCAGIFDLAAHVPDRPTPSIALGPGLAQSVFGAGFWSCGFWQRTSDSRNLGQYQRYVRQGSTADCRLGLPVSLWSSKSESVEATFRPFLPYFQCWLLHLCAFTTSAATLQLCASSSS